MAAEHFELKTEAGIISAVGRFLTEQKQKCKRLRGENITKGIFTWMSSTDNDSVGALEYSHCQPHFDGLLCWPYTNASTTANLPCPPGQILGYDAGSSESTLALNDRIGAIATKDCLENGQWYTDSGDSWSNYSLCEPFNELNTRYFVETVAGLGFGRMHLRNYESYSWLFDKWLPIVRIVSQIGYASSFAMLIVAMIVFSLLRKLRNPRNRLHMHLFASFIMRAATALLRDWIFRDGVSVVDVVFVDEENAFIKERNVGMSRSPLVMGLIPQAWICKAFTSAWQYFIVANYSWILMEGLYLHNLVFLAFCTDTAAINLYILMGWGLPVFVVVPWIIIRATIEDTLCWTVHENTSLFLFIRIPIMISILFNFLLFINIVRVLFIKFKTSVYLQRKKMQYSRWAKSTLVLVPLFGAHYTLFLGLSYHKDLRVEIIWLFCDQLFASFQGSFVALLYCLLNIEVRTEIRRAWRARWSKKADVWISACRVSKRRKENRRGRRTQDFENQSLSGTTMRNLFMLQVDKKSNEFRSNVLEMERA